MNEQAKSRVQAVIEGACNLAETIETVSEKVVNFIDEFAVNLEKQIDKVEAAERAEAMKRHPAGKGRVDGKPSRAEKIKIIQAWLMTTQTPVETQWFTNPDGFSDWVVDYCYGLALNNS